ncbi:MAG: BrnT family toxin [Deltaproteobacteria bacterium]|nr:BrnT family toxin [Deltaproteobacteria bacterium]
MRVEWDPEKARRNLKKDKVSFEESVTAFHDPLSATFDDPDRSDDEQRYITIGFSTRGRLLVVAHAERGAIVRIISARHATAHERKRHAGQEKDL